jgi:hypothetical protein
MKRIIILVIILLCSVTTTYAGNKDLEASEITSPEELRDVTREVGHAISIPSMIPADPLGTIPGIDIGIEVSSYELDKTRIFFDEENLILTRVHVQKGLPFRIDFGAQFSKANESNIRSIGVELRGAVLEDALMVPAIGVRVAYSELAAVSNFDIKTYSIDAQISKTLIFITPYVGGGYLSSKGKITGIGLDKEEVSTSNVYAGLKISFIALNLTLQADYSENTMYTFKLGLSF